MDERQGLSGICVSTLRTLRRPVMYLPAILAFVVPQTLGLGLVVNVIGLYRDGSSDALQQWIGEYGGLISVGAFALALAAPAVASGLAALAAAAVEQRKDGWKTFWGGLGTYYWKIVGANVLFGLALLFTGRGALREIAGLVAGYFFAPHLAAIVMDGTGVFDSISRGARFAWKTPGLLLPIYGARQAGKYLAEALWGAFIDVETAPVIFSLKPGWFVGSILGGTLNGYLHMFFTLACFAVYRLRKAAPDAGGPAEVREALPTPPAPPVSPV